jgi:chromosome segregation ATPase
MSRFSALKIEDDFDADLGTTTKKPTVQSANKKANKQKNGPKEAKKNLKQQIETTADWTTWKQKDEQFTDDLFKEQLKKALVESKIEFETNKVVLTKPAAKVSKKPSQKIMSLNEFQNSYEVDAKIVNNKLSESQETEKICEKFADQVDQNLENYLLKDKIINNERLDKNDSADIFINRQYKEEVSKRDEEIVKLNQTIAELKDEITNVKKRNKQLAFIMASGEMKEKSELLEQIEELTQTKAELTSQISEISTNYEQEKSKVHQLENEIKKSKQKH